MEFLDEYEDGRPRFIFQSRPLPSTSSESPQNSPINKPILITCLAFSLLLLLTSFFFLHSQLLHSIFLWLALSLLVGPFAPLSLTLGDIRVGRGRILEFPPPSEEPEADDFKKKVANKRSRGRRSDLYDSGVNIVANATSSDGVGVGKKEEGGGGVLGKCGGVEETEWSEEDLGLLKKQIAKNPVGKPRRWEVIAEAFGGRHSVESVIKEAKGLGKAKPDDSDSYSKFLKDRKPVDKRADDGGSEEGMGTEIGGEVCVWSSSEDIALLNALKAFPKEVAMRWEKISAAVPGKSKAACMKRVGDLKKEFRSSKASNES